jgi:hypothetical protein
VENQKALKVDCKKEIEKVKRKAKTFRKPLQRELSIQHIDDPK